MLHLTEARINAYGQMLPGDQFDEVIDAIKAVAVIAVQYTSEGYEERSGMVV